LEVEFVKEIQIILLLDIDN